MASKFRIHLPNIIFQLIHTPDLPCNQIAFKVPQHVNKLDIQQYLTKIYQLPIADVRTMNYLGYKSNPVPHHTSRVPKYKKAIITLGNGETFTWPDVPSIEDLNKIGIPHGRPDSTRGKNSLRHIYSPKKVGDKLASTKSKSSVMSSNSTYSTPSTDTSITTTTTTTTQSTTSSL